MLLGDLSAFLSLMSNILKNVNADKIEREKNIVGVNSVITQMRTNIPTNSSGIKTNKYSLTSSTRNVNRHNCQAELFDVI